MEKELQNKIHVITHGLSVGYYTTDEANQELFKLLTTPTDTETNYLLQGKNGERLRESIEQAKDTGKLNERKTE